MGKHGVTLARVDEIAYHRHVESQDPKPAITPIATQTSLSALDASPAAPDGLAYARRVYDRVMDWYKVAETKAQLLLTANGAFAAIFLGLTSGNVDQFGHLGHAFGPETWLFSAAAVAGFCTAVGFASAALLSRHKHNIKTDFERLDISPSQPASYKIEAVWYFGHIASLDFGAAVDLLRTANHRMEFEALTYNVVGLSRVVLRKHRLVNAGWTLTALAIVFTIAAAVSLFLRGQI